MNVEQPTNGESESDTGSTSDDATSPVTRQRWKLTSWLLMLARRTHLYAGLFLLPWVVLYGVTGAMFNHQSLFPRVQFQPVPVDVVRATSMPEFPAAGELANQVIEAIRLANPEAEIEVLTGSEPEFTNNLMFEVQQGDDKKVVYINPVTHDTEIATIPPEDFRPDRLLPDTRNIELIPNPQETAQESAAAIFKDSGIEVHGDPKPFGWTKLNFLVSIDGEPARVTYVLKDGHVDIFKYDGEPDMPLRGFFLRLHTSHGQPPTWNGRMYWSLFVDAMAIAMVTWSLTGLLMWWQIKRTRCIGFVVLAASFGTAALMYFVMQNFYASTML
ncbi:MAG: PepSY domain-containing protein [Planctomycetaceae bacterium]